MSKPENVGASITRADIDEILRLMASSVPSTPDPLDEARHLRDYFAGQALAGWLATYDGGTEHPAADDAHPHWVPNIAKASYRFADAMLAERSK